MSQKLFLRGHGISFRQFLRLCRLTIRVCLCVLCSQVVQRWGLSSKLCHLKDKTVTEFTLLEKKEGMEQVKKIIQESRMHVKTNAPK